MFRIILATMEGELTRMSSHYQQHRWNHQRICNFVLLDMCAERIWAEARHDYDRSAGMKSEVDKHHCALGWEWVVISQPRCGSDDTYHRYDKKATRPQKRRILVPLRAK